VKTLTEQAILREAVLQVVLKHGETQIQEVTAAVGHMVTAATAARWMDMQIRAEIKRQGCYLGTYRPPTDKRITMGRRGVISHVLRYLTNRGRIRRVARGVYAPPLLPKAR
jgi:hypothetical protein